MQCNEINQSVYYVANLVDQEDITIIGDKFHKDECTESPHATINQLLEVSGRNNIKEIWAVKVRNSQMAKHYVILLKNNSHICSCLTSIRKEIICRHYFQVMLNTYEARFHIRLISSRWYNKGKDASHKPFIVADKFHDSSFTNVIQESNINYLCAIDKEKEDSLEH